jgi:hypothetical protein
MVRQRTGYSRQPGAAPLSDIPSEQPHAMEPIMYIRADFDQIGPGHCEEPEAAKQSRPGQVTCITRLLRCTRNDDLS